VIMRFRANAQHGFSLIELMIAVALGLMVSAGVIAIFTSTSNSHLAQEQLARLQEEGRFAITQIKSDLAMSGAQYCANTGGNAHATAAGLYRDGLLAPTVYASDAGALVAALSDVTTPWGSPYPSAPVGPYSLPSFFAMRGYDCTAKGCTPMDPSNKQGANGFNIPTMGTAVGKRVVGASVITVRYLNPSGGWAIAPGGSAGGNMLISNVDGTVSIRLAPALNEPGIKDFQSQDLLAMLADCTNGQIFAVSGQTSAELRSTGNNFVQPVAFQHGVAPKLFDLSRDFQTVTYYLKVVDNGDGMGHTTGALIRRVNGGNTASRGGSAEEIARGVERLDFKYGVQLANGTLRYYSAEQIDNSTRADCPPVPMPIQGSNDHGCLWRSVSLIEIDLLMDGQQPLYALMPDELAYTYLSDNPPNGIRVPQSPTDAGRKVTPVQQGFPLPMLRREFTAVVAVRNFNP
jgi:type IV pilus assembly protein PilW